MNFNFLNSGHLELKTSKQIDEMDWDYVRLFCHHQARYLIVTSELVHWLNDYIRDRRAIEIGSGCGDLAHYLDIPGTDSYQQEMPHVKKIYQSMGQPTIRYGKNVERLDYKQAIEKYIPDIVIGAWVTQWVDPNLPCPPGGGNIWGIKEDWIVQNVSRYILIGADEIHRHKSIMALPHETYDLPFVRSRRKDNRIWIWKN